jgi:hypothetical protein
VEVEFAAVLLDSEEHGCDSLWCPVGWHRGSWVECSSGFWSRVERLERIEEKKTIRLKQKGFHGKEDVG